MSEPFPDTSELLRFMACDLSEVRIPADPCEHRGGTWFDRAICPDPCGTMHDRCVNCGEPVDACPHVKGK